MRSGNMTPATLVVVLITCSLFYSAVASADNQDDPGHNIQDKPHSIDDDNITDTSSSESFQSTPSSDKSSPVTSDEVHSGSTENQNGERYDIYHKPCEAGYPCSQDQWCSSSKRRCRPCSDVEKWCNQTFIIHQNYTTCEDYCYRFQIRKTEQHKAAHQIADEEIKELTFALQNKELALDNISRKAEEERATASETTARLQSQLEKRDEENKRQVTEMNTMQADLVRCQDQKERTRDKEFSLQLGVASCVVIALVASGLAIKFKLDLRRLKARKRGTDNGAAEKQDNEPLVISISSDLGSQEVRSPVQADRNSTHFGSEADQLCLLGRQRPVGVCVPGDSAVAPS